MSKGTLCIGTGLISGRTNTENEFTVYTERGGLHGVSFKSVLISSQNEITISQR